MNATEKSSKVAVIGAGQMGSGIAQVFATCGYCVKVYDISEEIFRTSQKRILGSLQKLQSKDLIKETTEEIRDRISYHVNINELADCDIFIESAFENFAI